MEGGTTTSETWQLLRRPEHHRPVASQLLLKSSKATGPPAPCTQGSQQLNTALDWEQPNTHRQAQFHTQGSMPATEHHAPSEEQAQGLRAGWPQSPALEEGHVLELGAVQPRSREVQAGQDQPGHTEQAIDKATLHVAAGWLTSAHSPRPFLKWAKDTRICTCKNGRNSKHMKDVHT